MFDTKYIFEEDNDAQKLIPKNYKLKELVGKQIVGLINLPKR